MVAFRVRKVGFNTLPFHVKLCAYAHNFLIWGSLPNLHGFISNSPVVGRRRRGCAQMLRGMDVYAVRIAGVPARTHEYTVTREIGPVSASAGHTRTPDAAVHSDSEPGVLQPP